MVNIASFCREIIYDEIINNGECLGGEGKTVEIDESKFGRRKYNRGKRVEGQWVFGMLERESGKVVMVPVDKRNRFTLIPIIKRWIRPGTTIISDFWKAYNCLKYEKYQHLKVNHKLNFKDPITGANTNRIESSWRAAKVSYSSSGRRKEFFGSYLAKYMWVKKCRIEKVDPFITFFDCFKNYKNRHGNVDLIESSDIINELEIL